MTYDRERHHRRSIRLKGYDYTQAGAYFITIVTQQRACLFGEIADGEMRLNEMGQIVRKEWFRSAEIRREIEISHGEFVVMPNHVHGIVWIMKHANIEAINTGTADAVGATGQLPLPNHPDGPFPRSLASFIGGFKSAVTKRINECRGTPGAPVWQRGYYEHIIRNDESLNHIREYILNNLLQWALDRENPGIKEAQPIVPRPKDKPWYI